MAYVDLNPVRAGIADTPETSDFTAIQQRIRAWSTEKKARESTESTTQPALLPFRGPEHQDAPDGLPFAKADYLALVDWTGRAIREDKRGHIPNDLPPILERLGIAPEAYLRHMKRPTNPFVHVIGRVEAIREAAEAAGRRFLKGVAEARALFPTASS